MTTATKKDNATGVKLKITLRRSPIGCSENQCRVLLGLGLRKVNQVVEHYDSATIRGMLHKVKHLIEVENAA